MIGVITNTSDHDVVSEFFELFKTPWEFWRAGQHYDVLLCAGDYRPESDAKLLIVYAGRKTSGDEIAGQHNSCMLAYRDRQLPTYGGTVTFGETDSVLLRETDSGRCAAYLEHTGPNSEARIGYDLFSEVRYLLTAGQPAANAGIPALDLHIDFLRTLIVQCGISLAEIPPVPEGAPFIVCLTHDVDHPSLRRHKWDHTAFGFLYRAICGSLLDLFRGRLSFADAITNWVAALKLPFVYMGLAGDFWADFDTRYRAVEAGIPSTFFLIPYRDRPGQTLNGPAPAFRAAGYGAQDLQATVQKLTNAGCEIGLHGIDAWLNDSAGREELAEIRRLTGNPETGVRMHWLYFDENASKQLENAGAAYDSTIGYNETAGFRTGTTQAYKPLAVDRLMELPLHAMDTALFYPSHLGLSKKQADARLKDLAKAAAEFGGCFTINWHDRSLAPERLWGDSYRDLINDLKTRGAWFATAGQATAWFRKRRSATFEMEAADGGRPSVKLSGYHEDGLPGLRLRVYSAPNGDRGEFANPREYADVAIEERIEAAVVSEARR